MSYEGGGVWKGEVWGHPTFFVAYHDLPDDEEDSIPLHLLRKPGDHPPRRVAELVAKTEHLKKVYGIWFATLHPELWKEVGEMPELVPADWIQWDEVLKNVNVAPIIEALDLRQIIAVRGLNQVIQTAGLNQVIRTAGTEKVADELLKQLTPEQQEQLRQRLEKKEP